MDDFLDNHDNLSTRQKPLPESALKAGNLKGRIPIYLNDPNKTVIYCKQSQDLDEVRKRYCSHMGLSPNKKAI